MASNPTAPYVAQAKEAFRDNTLSPEEIADRVVRLCHGAVQASIAANKQSSTDPNDTPGLEIFLWNVWSALNIAAGEDASTHERIIDILDAIKAKGPPADGENWTIWREHFSWANLPIFGADVREGFNGARRRPSASGEDDRSFDSSDPECYAALAGDAPTDSPASLAGARARSQWLNTNAFVARLWARGYDGYAWYGIATMRMELEPLSLPPSRRGNRSGPVELGIEVAAVWVRVAGRKMYESREIFGPKGNPDWPENRGRPGGSGGTWDGVDGYDPKRWEHWKSIFREISQGQWRPNVVEAAKVRDCWYAL
ncbi:hypothetical protein BD413DRAFT_621372 [Trametes elegans]|nr:hypothetical protein BD413DRAFT_621372 [Trametes elegans]